MKPVLAAFVAIMAAAISSPSHATTTLETVLPETPIAGSGVGSFMSSVAVGSDGAVYTINVEPAVGRPTGVNLRTVVRKGVKTGGAWHWTATLIEPRTIDDPYHNQASIAIDRNGYIHVAYNMHDLPWQYAVSKRPNDISVFQFLGQPISTAEIAIYKFSNLTHYPDVGSAAIPGNQVTYPTFVKDRTGDLYVSYRYALYPKLLYAQRNYGCAIARYNVAQRVWIPIGGTVAVNASQANFVGPGPTKAMPALCDTQGWWADYLRLWFDKSNHMHVVWTWSNYLLGDVRPYYAVHAVSTDGGTSFKKSDGSTYTLPISYTASDFFVPANNINGFQSLTGDNSGNPIVVVQEQNGIYMMTAYNPGVGWSALTATPGSASTIVGDDHGTLWAFGTGLAIRTATSAAGPWTLLPQSSRTEDAAFVTPKVFLNLDGSDNNFYVHLTKCVGTYTEPTVIQPNTIATCTVKIVKVTR